MMRICIGAALLAALSACEAGQGNVAERQYLPATTSGGAMLVMDRPPEISVTAADDVESAHMLMERLSTDELRGRTGATFHDARELPWISGSATGREFLALAEPRLLLRGDPPERCAVAFAEGGAPSQPIADLATEALERCLAMAGPDCGCRVVAANSVLMVPLEEISYATGAPARLRVPSLGLEKMLVAEAAGNGREILRDVSHRVGEIEYGEDDRVTIRLDGVEGVFTGEARRVGFRRGRLAQRVYARNAEGDRLVLLIGFGPNELSELAGAWLAWPSDA